MAEGKVDRRSDRSGGEQTIETWTPGIGISIVWTLISVVLTAGSLVAFIAVERALTGSAWDAGPALVDAGGAGSDEVAVTLNGVGLLLLLLVEMGILVVHEAVHGAAFRYFGGRPVFGATLHNKVLPVLYASVPGSTFTRGQFAVIVLAPAVAITAVGLLLMSVTGLGLWVTVPLAVNVGGAVGDFWFAGMLLLKPQGTVIEDLKDGLRFYYPASA